MKTVKYLLIAFLLTPTLLFAQNDEETIQMEQQHKSEIFLEQTLVDFNANYHSIFIASYKSFEGITTGDEFKKLDSKHIKTSIDFQAGINEIIDINDNVKRFRVDFEAEQNELLALALQEEITNRILSVSPKGFVKTIENVDGNNITTLKFNPAHAEKSTYQPIIYITLNYESLTVQISINEPVKK